MIRSTVVGLRMRTEALEAYLAIARERPTPHALSAAAFHAGALRARADRALADARQEFGPRLRRVK